MAAGRRRSWGELRRAAIGEACIFEYGEEKGDGSLPFDPFERRDKEGNIAIAASDEEERQPLGHIILDYLNICQSAERNAVKGPHRSCHAARVSPNRQGGAGGLINALPLRLIGEFALSRLTAPLDLLTCVIASITSTWC